MKNNRILAGEVSTNAFLAFPRCMGITKKNDPHTAWEGRNRELRHLSSENVDACRSSDFCCCGFQSIWGRQTGILAVNLNENVEMIEIIIFFENCENQKCCSNHWWEQDFEAKRLQQPTSRFGASTFFSNENTNYAETCTLARVPVGGEGPRGSTIIFFQKQ